MEKFISDSPQKTEEIAAKFAEKLQGGEVIAFAAVSATEKHVSQGDLPRVWAIRGMLHLQHLL